MGDHLGIPPVVCFCLFGWVGALFFVVFWSLGWLRGGGVLTLCWPDQFGVWKSPWCQLFEHSTPFGSSISLLCGDDVGMSEMYWR